MSTQTLPPPDFAPAPRRARRRLVTPVTGALAAVLVAALGFLGGVEVQKHSGSSSSAATGGSARPSFAGGSGGPPSGSFPGAGGQGAGGGGQGTSGTVSSVKNGVLYVKDADGNTVRVKVSSSTDVTRTAATTAGKVHPGDTVTIQGKTSGATVTATSVTATAADN